MPYTATILFGLRNGQLTYKNHSLGQTTGVTVSPAGDIVMNVDFNTAEVHIQFKVDSGLKLVQFELKQPADYEYAIDGKIVNGKHDLQAPVESFTLVNRNSKYGINEYCLVAVDSRGGAHKLDPAVRNLGSHRPPHHPESCQGAFLKGFALGFLLAAALFAFFHWLLR